jgi:rhodanese-related sulfurtransferase
MINSAGIKKIARESFYIIVITAAAALIINMFHPGGFVPVGREALLQKKIVSITAAEAKIKFDGGALFIDSRGPSEYGEERISGALSIPASPESASLKRIRDNFNLLQGPRELVIYCDGGSCGSSEELAKRLLGIGYKRNIYVITEGLPEWKGAGYPTVK